MDAAAVVAGGVVLYNAAVIGHFAGATDEHTAAGFARLIIIYFAAIHRERALKFHAAAGICRRAVIVNGAAGHGENGRGTDAHAAALICCGVVVYGAAGHGEFALGAGVHTAAVFAGIIVYFAAVHLENAVLLVERESAAVIRAAVVVNRAAVHDEFVRYSCAPGLDPYNKSERIIRIVNYGIIANLAAVHHECAAGNPHNAGTLVGFPFYLFGVVIVYFPAVHRNRAAVVNIDRALGAADRGGAFYKDLPSAVGMNRSLIVTRILRRFYGYVFQYYCRLILGTYGIIAGCAITVGCADCAVYKL